MSIVLDASVSAAWHFRDQDADTLHCILDMTIDEGAVVPDYWQFETASALLRGMRQKRTTSDDISRFAERLSGFPLEIHAFARHEAFDAILPLAMAHGLKMFDAGYLALAKRLGIPLATFDRKLAEAARLEGVEVMGLSVG
jgi:predicted nucleic acid-binding protein